MGSAVDAKPGPPLRRLHIGLDILLGVLVLFVMAGTGLYVWMRASRPQLDGRLKLAALQAPVEVTRDTRGIPHIRAGNIHDLYVAQGYVMAQDRLWQMDLMRRLGEGRLAAVFGAAAVDLDERNRRLGLGRTAAAEAKRLDPREAELLAAFAAGVNANIAAREHHLIGGFPPEFYLMHYRPAAWRPEDTLALAAYMYQFLASDYQDKIERETFAAKLGPELAQQLFPIGGGGEAAASPPSIPGLLAGKDASRRPAGQGDFGRLPVFAASLRGGARGQLGGSNDWVLSGKRSFSGKPILANDPHLQFQVPGLWWAVQLTAPGLNAAGVAITGVPGVIIGHNDHIAWGVTNTRADVQDLYRETVDGKGNVLTPQGWRQLQHWRETIRVKGGEPVKMDIAVSPHGPVVAKDADGPLALKWTMYAPGALQSVHVFLAIDEARNWQEFEAAAAQFPGPVQNFVYADTAGHIGYQCAGWVPLRKNFNGSVPVAGASWTYEWQGWIPFDKLPRSLDPAAGVLATANGRITPKGYPYTISTDWDAPNRTQRIYQLLGELPQWNASAMGRIQTDVFSAEDGEFARALVEAGGRAPAEGIELDGAERRALGRLRRFRGEMGRTSEAPSLAYWTRQEMLRRVIAAKGGDELARHYHWNQAPVFEQWLLEKHPAAWLPRKYQGQEGSWDRLLLDSLQSVIERYTLDPDKLRWGTFETLEIDHPVYSHLPFARRYADLGPVEINGSPLTVKQARNTALGDANDLGPSMRFVADLSDWDRSTLTLVAGESGRLFSRHYRDEFEAYLQGKALPLWFSAAAVKQHAAHALTLAP